MRSKVWGYSDTTLLIYVCTLHFSPRPSGKRSRHFANSIKAMQTIKITAEMLLLQSCNSLAVKLGVCTATISWEWANGTSSVCVEQRVLPLAIAVAASRQCFWWWISHRVHQLHQLRLWQHWKDTLTSAAEDRAHICASLRFALCRDECCGPRVGIVSTFPQ